MFLDGVLIPARCLVNGSTITVKRKLERVDYFHVELDSHDVLLAEGAPSESFLDDNSRGMFHNASEFAVLCPDATAPGRFCAPKVTDGYELEAIRRRLAGVAGEMEVARIEPLKESNELARTMPLSEHVMHETAYQIDRRGQRNGAKPLVFVVALYRGVLARFRR